jgi:hypothetical protein
MPGNVKARAGIGGGDQCIGRGLREGDDDDKDPFTVAAMQAVALGASSGAAEADQAGNATGKTAAAPPRSPRAVWRGAVPDLRK